MMDILLFLLIVSVITLLSYQVARFLCFLGNKLPELFWRNKDLDKAKRCIDSMYKRVDNIEKCIDNKFKP